MTNKEKIEALKRQLILHPSYLNIIEELEKDLNLLEILKSNIIHWSVKYGTNFDEYNVADIIIQVRNPKEFIENGVHYTPGYKTTSDEDFKFLADFLVNKEGAKYDE